MCCFCNCCFFYSKPTDSPYPQPQKTKVIGDHFLRGRQIFHLPANPKSPINAIVAKTPSPLKNVVEKHFPSSKIQNEMKRSNHEGSLASSQNSSIVLKLETTDATSKNSAEAPISPPMLLSKSNDEKSEGGCSSLQNLSTSYQTSHSQWLSLPKTIELNPEADCVSPPNISLQNDSRKCHIYPKSNTQKTEGSGMSPSKTPKKKNENGSVTNNYGACQEPWDVPGGEGQTIFTFIQLVNRKNIKISS